MKRCWFGMVLLGVLLAGGLASFLVMDALHTPISEDLAQASRYAQAGDWEEADALTARARQRWDKYRRSTAALVDHKPMEDVEGLFARLEVYRNAREREAYAALCAQLSTLVRAIAEIHSPSWWNLL